METQKYTYKKVPQNIYTIYCGNEFIRQFVNVRAVEKCLLNLGIANYFGIEKNYSPYSSSHSLICSFDDEQYLISSFGKYKVYVNDELIPVSRGYEVVFNALKNKEGFKFFFDKAVLQKPDSEKKILIRHFLKNLGIRTLDELADVLGERNTVTIYF